MVSMPVSYEPPQAASSASPLAALVRRYDPDRFLTALFAPPEKRWALFALYAFNHELARAREVVSEPMLATIRLQWWREVIEGERREHEVAAPLGAAIDANLLDAQDLATIIDAREIEAEPMIPTLEAWLAYLRGGAGGVSVAAGRLLNAPDPEALRPAGAAFGAAGVLRSVSYLARRGRCLLPADVLSSHGLSVEELIAAPSSDAAIAAQRTLAREGLALAQASPPHLPREARAAALPLVLARRDLRRIPGQARPRGLGDRLAVVQAGLTGRLGRLRL